MEAVSVPADDLGAGSEPAGRLAGTDGHARVCAPLWNCHLRGTLLSCARAVLQAVADVIFVHGTFNRSAVGVATNRVAIHGATPDRTLKNNHAQASVAVSP